MQVTQAEEEIVRRVGVEEEFIKFRPSPNFKNMKKFLKNRSDYTETTTLVNHHIGVVGSQPICENTDQIEIKPVVQPPLPPYPPPPDSPPNLNVTIKQEKEDDDVQSNSAGDAEVNIETLTVEEQPPGPNEERPKKTICKEFIRGNCKRPVCKFAHEVDVSQLAGVFTFCWNYQNAVCTFPNCRFVHASVFEEAEFYRTGVLPPHARSHLKKAPPPPPPEESQRTSSFNNPPPPLHSGVEKPTPIISCIPASSMEQRPEDGFRTPLPRSNSPQKREWSEIDEFSSSPRDLETNLAKKCKNCEIMEFSLKYNKEMVENLIQSSEEINKKMGQLNKKSTKLFNVLVTLLKPATTNKTTINNGLISNEKEKSMLEQLNNFVGTDNRLSSVINDDNLKNMVGGNINLSSLMAKLLCTTRDQSLPADSSRET